MMGSAYEFYRNQNRFISSFQRHKGRFFFRTQKLHCLSVKHKTEVQERKVPDWAVNCGPNLLEGIRSALSFSDGQQFVHLQPIYWVHWCMLQHHTAYILYRIYFEAPHYTEPERPQAERVAIKIGKVSFGDPAWRSAPRRFGDERGGWDQRDSEILALRLRIFQISFPN